MSDTINDLTLVTGFGPFAPEVADSFLSALADAEEIDLPVESRKRLIERAEWLIPYHLQLIFSELATSGSKKIEPRHVDEAYEALLRPEHRNYFDWWHQRLSEELGNLDAAHALALLAVASQDPNGVPESALRAAMSERLANDPSVETLHGFLIDLLQSDGYLVEDEGRFRFRSPLLRDYWHRRVR